jgi:hypothetical protein
MVAAQEKTLKEAIQRLLTDSSIADVELRGNRWSATSRLYWSPFRPFRSTLNRCCSYKVHSPNPPEQVVKVGYPGSVLKKIVRYCYTDEVDLTMVSDTVTWWEG